MSESDKVERELVGEPMLWLQCEVCWEVWGEEPGMPGICPYCEYKLRFGAASGFYADRDDLPSSDDGAPSDAPPPKLGTPTWPHQGRGRQTSR